MCVNGLPRGHIPLTKCSNDPFCSTPGKMWLAPWRLPQHLAVKIRVIVAAMAAFDVHRIPSPISIMSWECNSIPWVPEVMKEPRNQDCDARAPDKQKSGVGDNGYHRVGAIVPASWRSLSVEIRVNWRRKWAMPPPAAGCGRQKMARRRKAGSCPKRRKRRGRDKWWVRRTMVGDRAPPIQGRTRLPRGEHPKATESKF